MRTILRNLCLFIFFAFISLYSHASTVKYFYPIEDLDITLTVVPSEARVNSKVNFNITGIPATVKTCTIEIKNILGKNVYKNSYEIKDQTSNFNTDYYLKNYRKGVYLVFADCSGGAYKSTKQIRVI